MSVTRRTVHCIRNPKPGRNLVTALYWLVFGSFYILMLLFVAPTFDKSLTLAALFLVQQRLQGIRYPVQRDFNDEVVGYQHNRSLCEQLEATTVRAGAAEMGDNLRRCYEVFVRAGAVEEREFSLLEAWLEDLRAVR